MAMAFGRALLSKQRCDDLAQYTETEMKAMSLEEVKDDECVVILPNSICGEVGENLDSRIESLITNMANAGWWPVDFGENTGKTTELWFAYEPACASAQAEHFIAVNGEV
jgi:hypothetical protein